MIVKDVKERVLPEVTDEWANDVSEFETVEELRADLAERISKVRKIQASLAARDKTVLALVDLVEEDAPEPMVDNEMQQRLQDLAMRLSAQGVSAEQYLEATGQTQDSLVEELRTLAVQAVKADLALRAVADAEGIEATEDDLDDEFASVASRLGQDAAKVREEFERAQQIPAVRSDVRKRKALDWLVDHVELVDEEGNVIDRTALAPEDDTAPGADDEVSSDVDDELAEEDPA